MCSFNDDDGCGLRVCEPQHSLQDGCVGLCTTRFPRPNMERHAQPLREYPSSVPPPYITALISLRSSLTVLTALISTRSPLTTHCRVGTLTCTHTCAALMRILASVRSDHLFNNKLLSGERVSLSTFFFPMSVWNSYSLVLLQDRIHACYC